MPEGHMAVRPGVEREGGSMDLRLCLYESLRVGSLYLVNLMAKSGN